MRRYQFQSASAGKVVTIEREGACIRIEQKKADGGTKRARKELASEAEARAECERMVRELLASGFVEQGAAGPSKPKAASKPAARAAGPEAAAVNFLDEADEPSAAEASPLLPRMSAAPGAGSGAVGAPRKKKKAGGKKKKRKKEGGDDLDKRVIAAVVAIGIVFVGGIGFLVYDAFLKPATIVGTWAGSMIEYEIGRPMIYTQYRLVLDESKRASLTLQEKFTSVGTYTVQGDRLKLTLKEEKSKDDDDADIPPVERQYTFALRRSTLDLFDPSSGKKVVQLLRFLEKPSIKGGSAPPPPPPPAATDLAADTGDADADARLASVAFSPKDGAFRLRHPQGWKTDTGSRPDNTYSWVSLTRGSAKIQVYADVSGSLMSGSDSARQYEEGSELAPVHRAHEQYKRTASGEYSDYKEGPPALFKGAGLGEGRIASFTASGGLFGSRLRGYRVTLLTNDRRISILCQCPEGEFAKLKPTFLAVCRSLSR